MKKIALRKYLPALLILGLTLTLTRVYFHPNFPYTHDGENHLARFANYKVAVREGQWPPRFAPNLMNHYGYPVFNYNYPLANILSLPFSFLKFNYELTFKILASCFVLMGLGGAYQWLKQLKFSQTSSLVAVSLFALSPYLISTIAFRGNIGEIMAWGLLPWLLLSGGWLSEKKAGVRPKMSVVILSLFLLSHNVAVLLGIPLLILYLLIRYKFDQQIWGRLMITLAWAIAITLWFWLPAIAEKNLIILDGASLSQAYAQHFPTLQELVFSPMVFGFSYLGQIDSLTFSLGMSQFFILLLSIPLISKLRGKSSQMPYLPAIWFSLLSILLIIFFQLKLTQPIWQILPMVRYIQFPWRLGMLAGVVLLPLSAQVFEQLKLPLRMCLLLLIIFQIYSFIKVKPADYFHKTNQDYDNFAQTTSTANENLPTTWKLTEIGNWQPTPIIASGAGEISVVFWNGSVRRYNLKIDTEAVIAEPTMFFPGWRTTIIDQDRKTDQTINHYQSELDPILQGRLGYKLAAGEYQVKSRFTGEGIYRLIGNLTSLLAGTLLVLKLTKAALLKYEHQFK